MPSAIVNNGTVKTVESCYYPTTFGPVTTGVPRDDEGLEHGRLSAFHKEVGAKLNPSSSSSPFSGASAIETWNKHPADRAPTHADYAE